MGEADVRRLADLVRLKFDLIAFSSSRITSPVPKSTLGTLGAKSLAESVDKIPVHGSVDNQFINTVFVEDKLILFRSGAANSQNHGYYSALLVPGAVSPRNIYLTKLLAVLLEKSGLACRVMLLEQRTVLFFKPTQLELGRHLVEARVEEVLSQVSSEVSDFLNANILQELRAELVLQDSAIYSGLEGEGIGWFESEGESVDHDRLD